MGNRISNAGFHPLLSRSQECIFNPHLQSTIGLCQPQIQPSQSNLYLNDCGRARLDLNMFQNHNSMGMRMDEKDEEAEVVGQSSMEELDYEASGNLEEESMEQQSENSTSNGVTGSEEPEKVENDETEKEVAVAGEGDNSVEGRAGSKESQAVGKNGNETRGRKKSGDETGRLSNGGSKSSEVCKPCNLVFENHRWLDTHVKSGDHNHVVKGFKPSSGRYFCYLCWLGFQYIDMLAQHYTKSDHKARARRKGVYGPLLKPGEARARGGDRSRSPVRVRLSDYYEVDSVGECDTRGARPRRLENRGKSSSKPPDRKNDKGEDSEKASKELAEKAVNNHHMKIEGEQKEKSGDSSLPKNEGNNNESNVNGVCGDHPSTEPNHLNEENSKEEVCEETFTESELDAVAISASGS